MKEFGHKEIMMSESDIKNLRIAETVVSTAIHPDNGEIISWPLRLSSFVPINMPIAFGMIITAPTPFNTILW